MLNIERISIFSSVFVFLQENKKCGHSIGENLQSASFLPKNTSDMFLFCQPQTIFPDGLSFPDWFLVPHSAIPHHTALSHGLEEQQNRILLVHTARPAAKNPFTIDTILWQEKLQNLQKNFLFFCIKIPPVTQPVVSINFIVLPKNYWWMCPFPHFFWPNRRVAAQSLLQ